MRKEVAAELEFAPEDYNGYANVTFAFDASAITEDTNLVVFETLLQDGVEVASHRDLADRKQTIAVSPIAIAQRPSTPPPALTKACQPKRSPSSTPSATRD